MKIQDSLRKKKKLISGALVSKAGLAKGIQEFRMKPPQRLNDKHRKAAQLMVKGLKLADIGRQVGYNADYLSFLSHECSVFQEYLIDCRMQVDQAYADGLERMYSELFKLDELRELRNRRRGRAGGPPART